MSKPILTIQDFQNGITYDETESTTSGFNDLSNIDLKSTLGIAQLSNLFVPAGNNTFVPTNNMVEYSIFPDLTFNGTTQAFVCSREGGANARIYSFDTVSKALSLFHAPLDAGTGCPLYSEMAIFNNRLFYTYDKTQIRSIGLWTGGQAYSINATGTNQVTISDPSGNKVQGVDSSLIGGTLWSYVSGSYVGRGITAVSGITLTLDATLTTGNYKGYALNPVIGVKNAAGTTTTLPTNNKTTQYRPMIDFNSKLYVGDGDMIYNLDSTLTLWSTTKAQGAISVGTSYVVKQFQQIGGYLYILADEYNVNYHNTFDPIVSQPKSRLYIWDGVSDGFQNIIEVGTHCYGIKVEENRIYAALESGNMDGVLFTYFNGSDFPTIAKFQIDNPNCPINCITYDRGRFFVAVNSFSGLSLVRAVVFSYSAYAIEAMTVSKEYEVIWPLGDNSYQLYGLDYLKEGNKPLLMFFDGQSGGNTYVKYSDSTKYTPSGTIQTQKYEITGNQFGQLVRGVQINCKEAMPANTSVTLKWRGDEETSFSTLTTTITFANQNAMIWGINRRYKKIQVQVILSTSDGNGTPKIVKIMLF